MRPLDICVFGLSITSSWGNGHATTYRSLIKALARRGHKILFFERDVPWYAENRDLAEPPYCRTILYRTFDELTAWRETIAQADLVILGSYVPEADQCVKWLKQLTPGCLVFYDIDTPVTLAKMARGDFEYLHPTMIPEFDMYWSFTGGPILDRLEKEYGARRALPLYCSVDTDLYYPAAGEGFADIALGYLGTYSIDRQPTVDELLLQPAHALVAASFIIAGAKYPQSLHRPENVRWISHLAPAQHRDFYNAQRFTLNVTRMDMIEAGYSPSVRLFEAGACGTPVISDFWPGLDSFFTIGKEILVARNRHEVLEYLALPETDRLDIARSFHKKVLAEHTSEHRAMEVEKYCKHAPAMLAGGGGAA